LDFTKAPVRNTVAIGQGALEGVAGTLDAIFRDDRTPLQIYADVKTKLNITIDNWERMTPQEQADAIGRLRGNISAELTKAAVTGGAAAGIRAVGISNGVRIESAAAGAVAGETAEAVVVRDLIDKASPPPPNFADNFVNGKDYVDAPDVDIPYGYPINVQGKAFEEALDATGTLGRRLGDSSKTFDFFDPATGQATSVKSLNTLTDPKLKNPAGITQALNKYVDDLIHYEPRDNSKIDMQTDQINSKALVVAIPKGTTAAQLAAIAKAVDKAKLNGIKIKIVVTGK
jgi:hypothetical protein